MTTKLEAALKKARKALNRVNISSYNVYSGSSYFYYRSGQFNNGKTDQYGENYVLSMSATQRLQDFKKEMFYVTNPYGNYRGRGLILALIAKNKTGYDSFKIKGLNSVQHEKLAKQVYELSEFREAFKRTKQQVRQLVAKIDLKNQQYQLTKKEVRESIKSNAKSYTGRLPLVEICELMDEVVKELTVEGVMVG